MKLSKSTLDDARQSVVNRQLSLGGGRFEILFSVPHRPSRARARRVVRLSSERLGLIDDALLGTSGTRRRRGVFETGSHAKIGDVDFDVGVHEGEPVRPRVSASTLFERAVERYSRLSQEDALARSRVDVKQSKLERAIRTRDTSIELLARRLATGNLEP